MAANNVTKKTINRQTAPKMNAEEIAQLATVLRNNGDKVLNGEGKLSLSTSLLNTLNGSFSLVTEQRDSLSSSFQVLTSNSNAEMFGDLRFLHDFVQRSRSLKLIPSSDEAADVSLFKNLKFLELNKVSADWVVGIQTLRAKLKFIVCIRSVKALKDVLEECGGDKCSGFLWNELRGAVFSYNEICSLDASLELTPWLHTLDLSHNNLKSPIQLNCLSSLKYLNLSYNKLEHVPKFAGQICNRLQVLVLKGNFIEDLRNISALANLCELDLSDNCLLEHSALSPISFFAALRWLSLEGNPLSYHPQHRAKTVSYLHSNTNTVRFLLDGAIVSKSEQRLVGTLHGPQNFLASYSSVVSDVSTVVTSEKQRKIKQPEIVEEDSIVVRASPTSDSLTTSSKHLETKRQLKELRSKYGESWLKEQAGAQVQEALGLEPKIITSSPYESDFIMHAEGFHSELLKEKADLASEQSINTFETAPDSTLPNDSIFDDKNAESSSEEEVDLGDGDESMYLVTKRGETEDLFFVVTKNRIYERDCITSKIKVHWHIESLVNCELVQDEPFYVKLEFDTLRKDKKQREYVLEKEEANRLFAVLKVILDNKAPDENTYSTAYQCMKCSHRFVVNNMLRQREKTLECPVCQSTVVVEQES